MLKNDELNLKRMHGDHLACTVNMLPGQLPTLIYPLTGGLQYDDSTMIMIIYLLYARGVLGALVRSGPG